MSPPTQAAVPSFSQIGLRGMTYGTAWIMIGEVTLWYAVLGAVAAMLDRKTATG